MKRVLLIPLCLAVAALVIIGLLGARRRLPPRVVFPTGDSALLHRLTHGTNHIAPKPQGWPLPRFARFWLFHHNRGRPDFHNLITAEPSLVLWIENTPAPNQPAGATGRTWLTIADESGHPTGDKVVYIGRYRPWTSAVAFTSWPRSSQRLTVRWFEETIQKTGDSQSKLVGEWVVANPAWQPPADWPAERLPVTRTNGSLQCTLERAAFGLGYHPEITADSTGRRLTYALADDSEAAAVVLVPRFTAALPGVKWEVGSVLLHDVHGNEVWREHFWMRVDETCCSFAPALSPASAWELTIFAKRQVPFCLPVSESFSSEELLVFKDLDLAGPGKVALNQELARGGAVLRLTQFTLRAPQNLDQPWDQETASELLATFTRSHKE